MINYDGLRTTVAKGLKKYLNCPVIRSNQNAEPPKYPYVTYSVITLMSANNGTYGEYEDNIARKPVTTTWSVSALSDDNIESVTLANKAREWLDRVGTVYLNDNNVIVQSVTAVANRDNVLSVGYEYKNGFDCVFWCFDEVEMPEDEETIETVTMGDDSNQRLESRLDGIKLHGLTGAQMTDEDEALNAMFERRINGVE